MTVTQGVRNGHFAQVVHESWFVLRGPTALAKSAHAFFAHIAAQLFVGRVEQIHHQQGIKGAKGPVFMKGGNAPAQLQVVMGWSRPNKAGSIAYRKTYARRPFHEDRYHYWH